MGEALPLRLALPTMSIHYGQFCPISKAAEVLGERWTILIIRELLLGTSRYSDFQRALSKISPTLLTKRLNQLVDCGLVLRQSTPGQSRATYHLTPAGLELQPIVLGLGEWGMKWARGQMRDDELDVQLLMYDFCRRIDATRLPAGRTVIGFVFPGLPKFAHWWIVIEADRERELCVDHPGKDVDIAIRTSVRTMTEIWAGDTNVRAATKSGRLQLSGNPALIRSLASWLRPGMTAHIRPSADALRV
jgi:DNA-binding HxlR family transcriptional regulator